MKTKLDKLVQDAVMERRYDAERFNSELRAIVNDNLQRAAEIERRNLVDEAKWRRDER